MINIEELKFDENGLIPAVVVDSITKKVLTVAETGLGRLSDHSEYRLQSRAGKGVLNYHTAKYGEVASVLLVGDDNDIILISSDGIIIRIKASQINTVSRTSKGVRVMRVSEGEKLVSATAVSSSEDEETTDIASEEETETQE